MIDLKQAVAYLYQRAGKSVLSRRELELTISHGLRWFNPEESKKMIDVAINSGYIIECADGLTPAFNYKAVELPLELEPSKSLLEAPPPEPLVLRIVNKLVDKLGVDKRSVMSEINQKADALKIELEVAALIVGGKYNIDLTEFFDDVEQEVIGRVEK